MITLTGQTTFERFNVYRDDVNPLQFYYMPGGPRVALDEKGKPIFSLIMYRRDLSAVPEADRATKLGGGILALSVELKATDDEKKRMRAKLAEDPIVQAGYEGQTYPKGHFWLLRGGAKKPVDKAKVADALILGMVPVQSGTVTVQIAAEDGTGTTPGEFVDKLVGAGPASMVGNERASCMAKLTMEGAELVWAAMDKNLKIIRVAYTLDFSYRVVGLVVDAWCDAKKAYDAMQSQLGSASEDGRFHDDDHWHTADHDKKTSLSDIITQSMSSSEISNVTITTELSDDILKEDAKQTIIAAEKDQIKQFIADTFTSYKPLEATPDDKDPDITTELPTSSDKKYGSDSVSNYTLKKWDDSMSANFHDHLSEQMVVKSTLNPNDNMSNLLNGQNVNDYRVQVSLDSAFYKFLDVMVVCTADFDNDPINMVKAHLTYSASGPQGPINQIDDYLFQKGGTPQQRFSTYIAGVDKQTYNYEYEIYYKGSTDKYSIKGQSTETILVLNADQLGILKVDVQVGIIDWDQIRQVMVKMTYGTHETEFTLDAQHQSHRWTEVIGEPVTDSYTWSATFIDKSEQRIEIKPTQQRGALVINQPIGEQLDLTIVSVGSFGGQGLIQQVGVAVRYVDQPNNYNQNGSFLLTKEGDVKEWKVALVNTKLRTFQYQVTVFYTGGVTRVDDWRTSDSTILPVGDPFGFKLTVLPYLLKNTPWAFGTLKVKFNDSQTDIHAEDTLQVTDYATPLSWRFRLGAVDRHTYRYQLSLYQADNTSYDFPEAQASDAVLVLRPPPKTT